MRIAKLLIMLALVTAVAGAEVAKAQQPQGGPRQGGPGGFGGFGGGFGGFGRGGFGGGGLLGLARIEAVQKEIEALDEQVADINKLVEEQRAQRPGQGDRPQVNFQELSEEERNKLIAEFRERAEKQAAETNAKLEEILLPNQIKRLKEIALQQQGTQALNSPEVAEQLKITDEQKEKLAAANRENQEAMQKAFADLRGGGGQPDFAAMGEKMRELRKAADDKLLAVLTDEQKAEFEKLKGEPFEIPREAFGRGGFGGGRRPGGRPEGEGAPARPQGENN